MAHITLPLSDEALNAITDALATEFPNLHVLRTDEPDGGTVSFYVPSTDESDDGS